MGRSLPPPPRGSPCQPPTPPCTLPRFVPQFHFFLFLVDRWQPLAISLFVRDNSQTFKDVKPFHATKIVAPGCTLRPAECPPRPALDTREIAYVLGMSNARLS